MKTNNKKLKLYFLGGPVQNVSQTLGLNGNASQRLGGITDVTEGILTGNPASIVSGGLNMAGASINSIKNTFKDKDSSVGDKILSASGIISPFAGIVSDQILGNKNKQKEEYKLSLNDRNATFGNNSVFKDGGSIHIDPSKRGTFKAQATRMGVGVQEAANKILNAPEGKYSPTMRRKANFAKNFAHADGGLIEYNNGGSHESNKFGGIPMGISPDGQMNTVEEGETRNEDYVFSDRRKVNMKDLKLFNLPKKLEGKTYADISKKLNKEYEERPHDNISKNTKESMFGRLKDLSEYKMPNKQNIDSFADGGGLIPTTKLNTGLEFDKLNTFANETIPDRARDIMASGDSSFLSNFDISDLRYAAPVGSALDYLTTTKPKEISLQKSLARFNPNYISTEGLDAKLASSRNKTIGDIYGTSGGNLATARANVLGADSSFLEEQSDAYRNIALSNMMQNQAGQEFNVNQDRFNIGQSNQEEQINAQNPAAYTQAKRQGLQNIFQNIGNIGQEQELGEMVTKAYGYTPQGNKKKCGGKLRFKMK